MVLVNCQVNCQVNKTRNMLFIFQKEEKNSQLKLACRLSRQAAVKISIVVHFCLFHIFHNYFSAVSDFCDVKPPLHLTGYGEATNALVAAKNLYN
jgi:hypothetical protein